MGEDVMGEHSGIASLQCTIVVALAVECVSDWGKDRII